MKKVVVIIAALCAALVVVGCASTPSASEMMSGAKNGAPMDTLVGQATGDSEQKAADNAKYQLARAMSFIVKDMVDATVASGVIQSAPAETFRLGVNTALTRINLSGAVKQGSGVGSGKVYWAVYYMDKSEVIKVINQAVTASKQANPGAAAFSVEKYIDQAYATHAAREWKN
jgi:hypothetical protein